MDPRFTRQVRLAEVGEAGQQRIQLAAYVVKGVEAAVFLHRAGAQRVAIRGGETGDFVHEHAFQFGDSRHLAEGAWRALGLLRAELQR